MAKGTVTKVIAGALALAGVYFIYKYFQPKKKEAAAPAEPTPTPTPLPLPISGFPLKKGSKGNAVKSLQQLLLKIDSKILPKYGADGDFGSETEAALKAQTGKTTCTSAELVNLELLASRASGTWYPPMANPDNTTPLPPFGF